MSVNRNISIDATNCKRCEEVGSVTFSPTLFTDKEVTYGIQAHGLGTDGCKCGDFSDVTLVATTSSEVRNLVIKDKQLIFIQDVGRIAFDYNGTRVFYNQIVTLNTEADRQNLDSPISGYYFVINTGVLWFYQDVWIPITGTPKEILFVGTELPELGEANKLYVDTDDREISVWDDENKKFVAVSNYMDEASDEDIDGLFS